MMALILDKGGAGVVFDQHCLSTSNDSQPSFHNGQYPLGEMWLDVFFLLFIMVWFWGILLVQTSFLLVERGGLALRFGKLLWHTGLWVVMGTYLLWLDTKQLLVGEGA